jgi:hypothetical protein
MPLCTGEAGTGAAYFGVVVTFRLALGLDVVGAVALLVPLLLDVPEDPHPLARVSAAPAIRAAKVLLDAVARPCVNLMCWTMPHGGRERVRGVGPTLTRP